MKEKTDINIPKYFYENPFKKQIVLEPVKNFGPIVEKKLIIHHKRNLRKTMMIESKEQLDKILDEKEKFTNSSENKSKTDKTKIIPKIKNINRILLKKGEYPFLDDEKNEMEKQKKEHQIEIKTEVCNPFMFRKNKNIEDENNKMKNPFIMSNIKIINKFDNQNKVLNNPFLNLLQDKINKSNPFMNSKDVNLKNPFLNIQNDSSLNNPFISKNNNNSKNPFLDDDKISQNPFFNINSSNIFTFNSNNIEEAQNEISDNEDEEIKKIEEEVKIERDENKLKNLKEVSYSQKEKFFEINVENLQFLEQENGKNKYISKGTGMFSLQQEKDKNGKNIGIFILRENSTKHIKLQGIIIDSTTAEKSKLKNGLEFIFVKNIIVKYSKYEVDNMKEETKLTFLRIKVNKDDVDNFYNKINEFFNLVKK